MQLGDIGEVLRSYPWKCTECKICEICHEKGDDVRLDFIPARKVTDSTIYHRNEYCSVTIATEVREQLLTSTSLRTNSAQGGIWTVWIRLYRKHQKDCGSALSVLPLTCATQNPHRLKNLSQSQNSNLLLTLLSKWTSILYCARCLSLHPLITLSHPVRLHL